MLITCVRCKGSKEFAPLGGIKKKCEYCKATGLQESSDAHPSIEPKKATKAHSQTIPTA